MVTDLLPVGWGGLAKLIDVIQDGIVLGVGCLQTCAFTLSRRVGRGTKVKQAGFLGVGLELGRGQRQRRRQQWHGERLEMHDNRRPSEEDLSRETETGR